jgi:hypothetical protein
VSSTKEYNQTYYKNNREQMLAAQKARDSVRKEAISVAKAVYYQRTKEAKKTYVANYRKKFPAKVNALNRKHQLGKEQRTPKWLTPLHYQQIEMFYQAAQDLTKEFGVQMEVDHMTPLHGKNVSGLHVPWNLQVITKVDNIKKTNKHDNK